ncbi:MarR family transcriptional regulator [Dyella sp. 2HG41-7]|uniref:MarR family winged helix-turn-helix transcriptional regulator n=1 Tax=Dyella sp. 2HG41-7 TaxID=2883239 RepID=UPI001F45036D|nr:MarR family transcriptional regulator [Dyella sp. 2HG41-7]
MNNEFVNDSSKPRTHSVDKPNDLAEVDALYTMAEVSRILKYATSAIEKLAQVASGTSDLTLMHCLVLVHLSRTPSCKQVDLKSVTGITPAHLTKLVDELVNRGFVRRHRSSGDRRQVILALTTAGRETVLRVVASLRSHSNDVPLGAIEELGSSLAHWVAATHSE